MAMPLLNRLRMEDFFRWVEIMYKSHPVGLQGNYAKIVAEISESILLAEKKGFEKVSEKWCFEDALRIVVASALAHDIYNNPYLKNFSRKDHYRNILRANLEKTLGLPLVGVVVKIVDGVNGISEPCSPEELFMVEVVSDARKIYMICNWIIPSCQEVMSSWSISNDRGTLSNEFAREFVKEFMTKQILEK